MDIKYFPKTQKDFKHLEKVTKHMLKDDEQPIIERDWTQDEINLFVEQFNGSQEEVEPHIDMNKLDPKFITYEEIAKKYEGFSPEILDILYECENKKLEDARLPPLRVKNQSIKLINNLSDVVYIDDDQTKTKSETSSSDISYRETEEEEEEEEEEECEISV
tara:strand:+ start:1270 stop:1755 length:486 start_codon:yes stop_codon:yes gene_type:complete